MRYSIQKWVLFCVMVLGARSAEGMMTSLKEWGGTIQKYSGYLLNSVKNFSSDFPLWSYEKPVLPTATPSTGISPKSSSVEPSLVNEVFAHMTKNQEVGGTIVSFVAKILRYMTKNGGVGGAFFDPGHFSEAIKVVLDRQRAQYRQNLEKEKAELLQKPEKSSMKYTMSFIQMAGRLGENATRIGGFAKIERVYRFNENGIVLAPTGLWNEGKYTSDAKDRWEVEYKGKKYVSTFNKDKKIWESNKKDQMDLLTYYEYLSTNNWGELRNLYSYLIDILYPIEKDKIQTKEALLDALMCEERYKNHVVFYQGGRGTFAIIEAFNTALHRYLDVSFMRHGRSRFENLLPYASSHEFLGKYNYMERTTDYELKGALVSTNLGLFGNLYKYGESTVQFFTRGRNVNFNDSDLKQSIGAQFRSTEIPIDEYVLKDFIENIFAEYSLQGRLTQVFIPQNHVDKFAYISRSCGTLIEYGEISRGCWEKFKNLKKGDLLDFIPSKVISQMRGTGHVIHSGDDDSDLQGRILWSIFADPEAAEKMGVKIFHYYAEKGEREKVKKMAEEVDAFVKKLIVDALKKGTLKAKDVKLLALKKAVEEKMKGSAGSSAEKSAGKSDVVKE